MGPEALARATEELQKLPLSRPEVLVVLGSGLGALAGDVEGAVEIPFADIPGLPSAGVPGHAGRFVAGRVEGTPVIVQAGRYHLYEGHAPDLVAAPVRLAHRLGVGTVILTNAAGGINPFLGPGSLMLIRDHVNLMWRSPLEGSRLEGEQRLPDMSQPYSAELRRRFVVAALDLGITLMEGTYVGVTGPSYETAAEVRMLRRLGGDVVGMSTIPEVLVARALGMQVAALSVVTNRATGLSSGPLSHVEVMEAGKEGGEKTAALIGRVLASRGFPWNPGEDDGRPARPA